MKIAIAADHRGFNLKQAIKASDFTDLGVEWVDVGAQEYQEGDDYPDYAKLLGTTIINDPEVKYGVIMCGSGVGVSVVANKFLGIRCGLALNPAQVKAARTDDNINVLALASDYTNPEAAIIMVRDFLSTEYSRLPKHTQRIEKIVGIEKENMK